MKVFITTISQCLALWRIEEGGGAEALLRCATDAAGLTVEGIPWTVRYLCGRYAANYGGTAEAVQQSMERALVNADVHQTVRSAICVLVGHALRDKLGRGWRNP